LTNIVTGTFTVEKLLDQTARDALEIRQLAA
jgi:hypothetical protein